MDKQNKKIPQLCGKDLCTACHACYNICSKKPLSWWKTNMENYILRLMIIFV